MSKVLLLWDFDHTLFDTVSFLDAVIENMHQALSDISKGRLEQETLRELFYQTYPKTLYRREQHCQDLAYAASLFLANTSSKKTILHRLDNALDFTITLAHEYLYPDAVAEIEQIHALVRKQKLTPVSYLVSYGEEGFQTEKIQYSRIGSVITKIQGSGVQNKQEVCAQLTEQFEMVFVINDKILETRDMVAELEKNTSHTYAVFMRRPNGKHSVELDDIITRSHEVVVSNLEQAKQFIETQLHEKHLH